MIADYHSIAAFRAGRSALSLLLRVGLLRQSAVGEAVRQHRIFGLK